MGLCGLSTHAQSLAGAWENPERVSWTADLAARPGLPWAMATRPGLSWLAEEALSSWVQSQSQRREPTPRAMLGHCTAASFCSWLFCFCFSQEYLDMNLPCIWIPLDLHVKAHFLPGEPAWAHPQHRGLNGGLAGRPGTRLRLLSIPVLIKCMGPFTHVISLGPHDCLGL